MLTPSTSIRPYSKPGRSNGEAAGPSAAAPIAALRNSYTHLTQLDHACDWSEWIDRNSCFIDDPEKQRLSQQVGNEHFGARHQRPYPVAWRPTQRITPGRMGCSPRLTAMDLKDATLMFLTEAAGHPAVESIAQAAYDRLADGEAVDHRVLSDLVGEASAKGVLR